MVAKTVLSFTKFKATLTDPNQTSWGKKPSSLIIQGLEAKNQQRVYEQEPLDRDMHRKGQATGRVDSFKGMQLR